MSLLDRYEKASKKLAWALGVRPSDATSIDNAIQGWVESYARSMEPPYTSERRIPGLHATSADEVLSGSLAALEPLAQLYAWAKLWLVHDSLFSGLRISITGPRLAHHIERVSVDFSFSLQQASALAGFFRHTSQDAGLDDEIWRRFKASGLFKPSAGKVRDEPLEFFVELASKRFGFSYTKVGRALMTLLPPDLRTKEALRSFRSSDNRASGAFVAEVVRRVGIESEDAQPGRSARATLVWFASSRTRRPSDRWNEGRARLEALLPPSSLAELSSWIRQRPAARYFGEKPYRDDLFCLLWKSASWYLGLEPDVTTA